MTLMGGQSHRRLLVEDAGSLLVTINPVVSLEGRSRTASDVARPKVSTDE
jgi:hypothetical protein